MLSKNYMAYCQFFPTHVWPLNLLWKFHHCEFIWDVLRDLVPSVQFKKREKHPWRSVTFSPLVKLEAAYNFTKSNTPPWLFFTLFKLYKWYQTAQSIRYIPLPLGLKNCFLQTFRQPLIHVNLWAIENTWTSWWWIYVMITNTK